MAKDNFISILNATIYSVVFKDSNVLRSFLHDPSSRITACNGSLLPFRVLPVPTPVRSSTVTIDLIHFALTMYWSLASVDRAPYLLDCPLKKEIIWSLACFNDDPTAEDRRRSPFFLPSTPSIVLFVACPGVFSILLRRPRKDFALCMPCLEALLGECCWSTREMFVAERVFVTVGRLSSREDPPPASFLLLVSLMSIAMLRCLRRLLSLLGDILDTSAVLSAESSNFFAAASA